LKLRLAEERKSKNPNHPPEGSSTLVEPIRDPNAIQQIKDHLQHKPRDLCIFILGINTAYRANELLGLQIKHVMHAKPGSRLPLKQSKNKQYRATYLNKACITSIENWLKHHPDPAPEHPLFPSRKRHTRTRKLQALQVSSFSRMVKEWCMLPTLSGNYASHSLRKTWGYYQRTQNNTPMPLLSHAYGHKSEAQTMRYIGIEHIEIRQLYQMEL